MIAGVSGWGIWTGKAGCDVRKNSEKAEGIRAGGTWADAGRVRCNTISLALLLANKEPEIGSKRLAGSHKAADLIHSSLAQYSFAHLVEIKKLKTALLGLKPEQRSVVLSMRFSNRLVGDVLWLSCCLH